MALQVHRCDSWVDWQGGKSCCMLFWAGREIHQETLGVMGLCTNAHLFVVSQWSFHVCSYEFGIVFRGSGTTTNGQCQSLFETSQCLLLYTSSVSSATGVGCSSAAFPALGGFPAVKSTDNESAGSAEGRGRKELHNFLSIFTQRGHMLYNLLINTNACGIPLLH